MPFQVHSHVPSVDIRRVLVIGHVDTSSLPHQDRVMVLLPGKVANGNPPDFPEDVDFVFTSTEMSDYEARRVKDWVDKNRVRRECFKTKASLVQRLIDMLGKDHRDISTSSPANPPPTNSWRPSASERVLAAPESPPAEPPLTQGLDTEIAELMGDLTRENVEANWLIMAGLLSSDNPEALYRRFEGVFSRAGLTITQDQFRAELDKQKSLATIPATDSQGEPPMSSPPSPPSPPPTEPLPEPPQNFPRTLAELLEREKPAILATRHVMSEVRRVLALTERLPLGERISKGGLYQRCNKLRQAAHTPAADTRKTSVPAAPRDLSKPASDVKGLISSIDALKIEIQDEAARHLKVLDGMTERIIDMQAENAELREQVASLLTEVDELRKVAKMVKELQRLTSGIIIN